MQTTTDAAKHALAQVIEDAVKVKSKQSKINLLKSFHLIFYFQKYEYNIVCHNFKIKITQIDFNLDYNSGFEIFHMRNRVISLSNGTVID